MTFVDAVAAEFVFHMLRIPSMQSLILRRSRQSSQPNFSGPAIRELPAIAPAKEMQSRFLALVHCADATKLLAERANSRLEHLVSSLQQQAFRGEL
jgi:restriction endonuclease S subunit